MFLYFSDNVRGSEEQLTGEILSACRNPIIDGLLNSVSGLLAVLNANLRTLALNNTFLRSLGISDPKEAFGIRTGEILQCVHAHETPGGCGTSEYCPTCGAAIAMVSCLALDEPVEQMCALTTDILGQTVDIALLVKAHPIIIDGIRVVLLFVRDISLQQQRAALERTFFHDVNNILANIIGASELLSIEKTESNLATTIHKSSMRLKKEIEIQRCLSENLNCPYELITQETTTAAIQEELECFFTNHPVKKNKFLDFSLQESDMPVKTDISLLLRILTNMITNALEASSKEGLVHVWAKRKDSILTFFVKNSQVIPEKISRRIFQRNYSTKAGDGRGLGTFSMKLLGENILGGKVDFTSLPSHGTVFSFSIPEIQSP